MLNKSAFDMVLGILKAECFYERSHQTIFLAMVRLYNRSQPIDIFTVPQELMDHGELELVGGAWHITRLTNAVVSDAHLETHCRKVLEKFLQRELIRISAEIHSMAYDSRTDIFDMLNEAEQQITSITGKAIQQDMADINTVMMNAITKIEHWKTMDSLVTGIPSGFKDWDEATRGFQPTDLTILGARPAVGKTAFALALSRNAAESGAVVAYFSLEMAAWQLILRLMSSQSEVPLQRLQTGKIDAQWTKKLYQDGVNKLSRMGIYFDDTPAISVLQLRAKARRIKRKAGDKPLFIVVDYLQLMTGIGNNREQEISSISKGLKNVAKELDCSVLALSQLSRMIEGRSGTKRAPQLSDLRESGAIEQDADNVDFLWGPGEEEIAQDKSLEGRRHWRRAKSRNGMLHTEELDFRGHIQQFRLYSEAQAALQNGNWKPVAKELF